MELYLHDEPVGVYPRLRGDEPYRIDYRHVIHSLLRKPGAFARYVYQEALYPSLTFRRAYDTLCEQLVSGADLEYIRILHLAATTTETDVEHALLNAGDRLSFDSVRERVKPIEIETTAVNIDEPDLGQYDQLLTGEEAA